LWSVPVLAQASSAGFEYSSAPPSADGKPPSESNLSGGSSSTSGVGGGKDGGSKSAEKGGSGVGSSSKAGGGSAGQGGQGSSGQGGAGSIGGGEQASAAQPGADSGSSSPLVPILIAIALLAAGSIAFVMIRKRRAAAGKDAPGQPGSSGPVSPEAG